MSAAAANYLAMPAWGSKREMLVLWKSKIPVTRTSDDESLVRLAGGSQTYVYIIMAFVSVNNTTVEI